MNGAIANLNFFILGIFPLNVLSSSRRKLRRRRPAFNGEKAKKKKLEKAEI